MPPRVVSISFVHSRLGLSAMYPLPLLLCAGQTFDTSSLASMNKASSSALLTVSASSLARTSFATRCQWFSNSRFLPMPVMYSTACPIVRRVPPSLVGSGRSSAWEAHSTDLTVEAVEIYSVLARALKRFGRRRPGGWRDHPVQGAYSNL